MRYTLTLQGRHERELRERLFKDDGFEGVAYVLCRTSTVAHDPWNGISELRLLSYEVVHVDDADIDSRDDHHVSWRSETFHRLIPECFRSERVPVLVHSHRGAAAAAFSSQDDANEAELFDYGWTRDGVDRPVGSIVISETGMIGRLWYGWSKTPFTMDVVRVIGPTFAFHRPHEMSRGSEVMARQVLAFGKALVDQLRALRVVVVGAGGTGSAAAMMLARLGVGKIAIIDPDLVETSNLNRLHGATQADADLGRTKASVVAESIGRLGLGISVRWFADYADSERCRDVLKSADLILGCTDDHAGRLFMNRFAYHYVVPVIDCGLIISVADKDGEAVRLESLIGRVTVVKPESTCLPCRAVTDQKAASEQILLRQNPGEFARLKAEAYVVGEGNPSPAVVTFTTEVAAMACNELLQRISNYRATSTDHRIYDFLENEELRLAGSPRAGCKFCDTGQYCGRGDDADFIPAPARIA